jgi:hypothetical protein
MDAPQAGPDQERQRSPSGDAARLTVLLDPAEDLRRAIVERIAGVLSGLSGSEASSRVVTPVDFAEPFAPALAPVGVRRIAVDSEGPAELERASRSLAGAGPGWVITLVPEAWLPCVGESPELFATCLLFASPDEADLAGAHHQASTLRHALPQSRVGATIHDVASLDEAESTFLELASRVEATGFDRLLSYGAVLDERAVLGGALGQSTAAADDALRPIAALLQQDLRSSRS